MTSTQAPRRRLAPSLLSTLLVLSLGAWIHPALSATAADARCDQPVDAPPMSSADDSKLAIRVIDHGNASAVAPDAVSLDDPVADPVQDTIARPTGPRVDIMLRRIFDEAQLRQPTLSEPEQSGDLSAPLAVDKTESVEEGATVLESEQADTAVESSGISADELLRYRQQMYRTDI